jgi:hypothetical protein
MLAGRSNAPQATLHIFEPRRPVVTPRSDDLVLHDSTASARQLKDQAQGQGSTLMTPRRPSRPTAAPVQPFRKNRALCICGPATNGLTKRKAHSCYDRIPKSLLTLAVNQFHTVNRSARAVGEIASAVVNPSPGRRRCYHPRPPQNPDERDSRIRFLTREIRSIWCSGE